MIDLIKLLNIMRLFNPIEWKALEFFKYKLFYSNKSFSWMFQITLNPVSFNPNNPMKWNMPTKIHAA